MQYGNVEDVSRVIKRIRTLALRYGGGTENWQEMYNIIHNRVTVSNIINGIRNNETVGLITPESWRR